MIDIIISVGVIAAFMAAFSIISMSLLFTDDFCMNCPLKEQCKAKKKDEDYIPPCMRKLL